MCFSLLFAHDIALHVMQYDTNHCIVLFKMFSLWFFANKKLIITLRTSKFGDVT